MGYLHMHAWYICMYFVTNMWIEDTSQPNELDRKRTWLTQHLAQQNLVNTKTIILPWTSNEWNQNSEDVREYKPEQDQSPRLCGRTESKHEANPIRTSVPFVHEPEYETTDDICRYRNLRMNRTPTSQPLFVWKHAYDRKRRQQKSEFEQGRKVTLVAWSQERKHEQKIEY